MKTRNEPRSSLRTLVRRAKTAASLSEARQEPKQHMPSTPEVEKPDGPALGLQC